MFVYLLICMFARPSVGVFVRLRVLLPVQISACLSVRMHYYVFMPIKWIWGRGRGREGGGRAKRVRGRNFPKWRSRAFPTSPETEVVIENVFEQSTFFLRPTCSETLCSEEFRPPPHVQKRRVSVQDFVRKQGFRTLCFTCFLVPAMLLNTIMFGSPVLYIPGGISEHFRT